MSSGIYNFEGETWRQKKSRIYTDIEAYSTIYDTTNSIIQQIQNSRWCTSTIITAVYTWLQRLHNFLNFGEYNFGASKLASLFHRPLYLTKLFVQACLVSNPRAMLCSISGNIEISIRGHHDKSYGADPVLITLHHCFWSRCWCGGYGHIGYLLYAW